MDILTQIAGNQGSGLSGILNQLFWAGLVIAVILAIVMIIRGGIEYMTIDAASNKESAKNRIKAAIGGLILCFSTILILNTINPGLTSLTLNFPRINNLSEVQILGLVQFEEANLARDEYAAQQFLNNNGGVGGIGGGTSSQGDAPAGTNTNGPIPTSYFGGPSDVRTKDGFALHYCNRPQVTPVPSSQIGAYVDSTLNGSFKWCWALTPSGAKIPYSQGSKSAHGGYFEPTSFGTSPLMRELTGDYIAYPLNNTAASRITGLPSVNGNSELKGKGVRLTLVNGTVINAAIRDRGPYGTIGKLDVSPALSKKIQAGGGLKSVQRI